MFTVRRKKLLFEKKRNMLRKKTFREKTPGVFEKNTGRSRNRGGLRNLLRILQKFRQYLWGHLRKLSIFHHWQANMANHQESSNK